MIMNECSAGGCRHDRLQRYVHMLQSIFHLCIPLPIRYNYYFRRLAAQVLTVRANVVEESIEALQRDTAAVAVGIAVSHAGRQAVAVMAVRLMGISVGASASDAAIAAAAATTAAATAVVALRDGSELHLQRACCGRSRCGSCRICCCRCCGCAFHCTIIHGHIAASLTAAVAYCGWLGFAVAVAAMVAVVAMIAVVSVVMTIKRSGCCCCAACGNCCGCCLPTPLGGRWRRGFC